VPRSGDLRGARALVASLESRPDVDLAQLAGAYKRLAKLEAEHGDPARASLCRSRASRLTPPPGPPEPVHEASLGTAIAFAILGPFLALIGLGGAVVIAEAMARTMGCAAVSGVLVTVGIVGVLMATGGALDLLLALGGVSKRGLCTAFVLNQIHASPYARKVWPGA
jgi:hypothetical protein